MNIALIGANGNFGLKRLKALQKSNDQFIALCDTKFDQLPIEIQSQKIPQYSNWREILPLPVDLVVVSLPDFLKFEVVVGLLKAKKNVLVEKPLSLKTAEVKTLFQTARENGVFLYVGYNLKFFPSVSKLLKLTQENKLGKLHHIKMSYGHGGIHSLMQSNNWRLGEKSWGGALVDMGTHLLSLTSEWFSEAQLKAFETQRVVSKTVEDHATLLMKHEDCLIELTASWTAWRSIFRVEVYGSEGVAEIESLVKYMKYGQHGERLRWGTRNPKGAPEMHEEIWKLEDVPFSAEVEFLDEEWKWLKEKIETHSFDRDHEEKVNLFVAQMMEKKTR